MPRGASIGRGLAVSLVVFALCAVVAEVGVRVSGLAPEFYRVQRGRFQLSDNPKIGYELVPHFEADDHGAMLDFRGKANSLGFRDRDHPVAKPAGAYRVLVLGDSIAQGLGIEHTRDVFPAVLERRLRESGHANVDVLNFAVSGYDTQQEVETLREKGLRFAPDLVVLAYCVNDDTVSRPILRELEAELEAGGPSHPTPAALRWSALARWAGAVVASRSQVAPDDAFAALGSGTVERGFADLAALARANGFDVLVAGFPALDGSAELPDGIAHQSRIAAMAEANGLPWLDLAPAFIACTKRGPVAIDRIHPNPFGHRCAGDAIAREVQARFLVVASAAAGAPGPTGD